MTEQQLEKLPHVAYLWLGLMRIRSMISPVRLMWFQWTDEMCCSRASSNGRPWSRRALIAGPNFDNTNQRAALSRGGRRFRGSVVDVQYSLGELSNVLPEYLGLLMRRKVPAARGDRPLLDVVSALNGLVVHRVPKVMGGPFAL